MEQTDRDARVWHRALAQLDRVASGGLSVAVVATVALVVRLAYLWLATWSVPPRSDAKQYLDLGRLLADGHGYVDIYPQMALHPTAFRPPGYPALLGSMFTVTGASYDAARYLNVLLGTGVVAMTFLLVRRHLGPRFDDTRLSQFHEPDWDRTLRQLALDNIRAHPSVVPKVIAGNVVDYFELGERSRAEDEDRLDGRSDTVRTWTLWLFYPFAIGGTVALWLRRRLPLVGLAGLTAIYFFVLTVAFTSPPRLRAPVELMWAIGIGSLFALRSRAEAQTAVRAR